MIKIDYDFYTLVYVIEMGDKGTWWSITAFDEDEIKRLTTPELWDNTVKTVYGGLEKCPTTGKVHYQGALQYHRQVRFSAVKNWLPRAHIELARSKDALIKYAMKEETAVADKAVLTAAAPYMNATQLMYLVAYFDCGFLVVDWSHLDMDVDREQYLRDMSNNVGDRAYKYAVSCILSNKPQYASAYMNPSIKGFYRDFRMVWLNHKIRNTKTYADFVKFIEPEVREAAQFEETPDSITQGSDGNENLIARPREENSQ